MSYYNNYPPEQYQPQINPQYAPQYAPQYPPPQQYTPPPQQYTQQYTPPPQQYTPPIEQQPVHQEVKKGLSGAQIGGIFAACIGLIIIVGIILAFTTFKQFTGGIFKSLGTGMGDVTNVANTGMGDATSVAKSLINAPANIIKSFGSW
jgi:hypothetical protein